MYPSKNAIGKTFILEQQDDRKLLAEKCEYLFTSHIVDKTYSYATEVFIDNQYFIPRIPSHIIYYNKDYKNIAYIAYDNPSESIERHIDSIHLKDCYITYKGTLDPYKKEIESIYFNCASVRFKENRFFDTFWYCPVVINDTHMTFIIREGTLKSYEHIYYSNIPHSDEFKRIMGREYRDDINNRTMYVEPNGTIMFLDKNNKLHGDYLYPAIIYSWGYVGYYKHGEFVKSYSVSRMFYK
jgi:hypothetical protein